MAKSAGYSRSYRARRKAAGGGPLGRAGKAKPVELRNKLRGRELANARAERLKAAMLGSPQTARAGSLPHMFIDDYGKLWGSDFGGRGGMAHRIMSNGQRGEQKRMAGKKIYPVTRRQVDSITRAGRYSIYSGDARYARG